MFGKRTDKWKLRAEEAEARHKKDVQKLKRERELRNRAETDARGLRNEFAELQRKYRHAIESSATEGGTHTEPPDDRYEELFRLAGQQLDDEETINRIRAYHASLEKKGYDKVWAERLEAVLSVLSSGENRLSRVLASVRRTEERRRQMSLSPRTWVVNDQYMDLPWRPAAAAYRSAVFEAVLDHIQPNTTKIIETGSGWGEHLCNIFLEGGPVDAGYYALELEEEGRKCSLLLGILEPLLKLEAHFFNYEEPDYAPIPRDNHHTILLTAHSIEQVSGIHPDFLYEALKLGDEVTGIHLEPVGWQMSPEESWSEISRDHHRRCTELCYNRNLWPLLLRAQEEGVIQITQAVPNFIGLDYNPASLIVWKKATAPL